MVTGKDKLGNEIKVGDVLFSEQTPVCEITIVDVVEKGAGPCFLFLWKNSGKTTYILADQWHKTDWIKKC